MKFIKLLQTSGLVRKKVLVRRKGGKPFWSTRWVQEGQDVKEVVRGLGLEVVEEEKPEKRESTGRVHLQGWMDSPSITANEVRIGDVRLFNNGEDTIINIEQKTPKTLIFTYAEKDSEGKNYTQNVRNTTKIVIKELYDDELKKERERREKLREELKKKIEIEKKKVVTVKPKPAITIKRSLIDIKNEIVKLQNKIYYTKERKEFDIIPGLNEQIEVLEKEVKEIENKPRELLDIRGDFIPAKTMEEATERINKFITSVPEENKLSFGEYGFNFDGLKLDGINSILHGFEKSMGKYGITLTFVGWNKRKQGALAKYVRFTDAQTSIQFQKTATKGVKKAQKKNQNNFDSNKIDAINKFNRYLTYPETKPGDHDVIHDKIAKMETIKRWAVQDLTNDPLAVIACHEGQHAIYFKHNLESKWKDNLTYYVGDDMHNNIKCASVSEYAMSEPKELFAEVGATVAFDIEIDPDVKHAYLETIRGINR